MAKPKVVECNMVRVRGPAEIRKCSRPAGHVGAHLYGLVAAAGRRR